MKLTVHVFCLGIINGERATVFLDDAKKEIYEAINTVVLGWDEPTINVVCRAILKAENEWNFPWWQFRRQARLNEFRALDRSKDRG